MDVTIAVTVLLIQEKLVIPRILVGKPAKATIIQVVVYRVLRIVKQLILQVVKNALLRMIVVNILPLASLMRIVCVKRLAAEACARIPVINVAIGPLEQAVIRVLHRACIAGMVIVIPEKNVMAQLLVRPLVVHQGIR